MNINQFQNNLIEYAASIGIDKIGFTSASPFHELKNRLVRQQELGYASGFEESDIEKRTHPELLLSEAESIIAIAIAYPSKMKDAPSSTKGQGGVFSQELHGEWITIRF